MAVKGKSAHSAGLWSIANVSANLAILPSQGNTAGSVTHMSPTDRNTFKWLSVAAG